MENYLLLCLVRTNNNDDKDNNRSMYTFGHNYNDAMKYFNDNPMADSVNANIKNGYILKSDTTIDRIIAFSNLYGMRTIVLESADGKDTITYLLILEKFIGDYIVVYELSGGSPTESMSKEIIDMLKTRLILSTKSAYSKTNDKIILKLLRSSENDFKAIEFDRAEYVSKLQSSVKGSTFSIKGCISLDSKIFDVNLDFLIAETIAKLTIEIVDSNSTIKLYCAVPLHLLQEWAYNETPLKINGDYSINSIFESLF